MKLADATNYMIEVSSKLETIDKLIKEINSLINNKELISIYLKKDDVTLDYYTKSKTFVKEVRFSDLQDQIEVVYTELINAKDLMSKLLEEK